MLPHICKDAGSLIRFKNIFKSLWDSRFLGHKTVNSPVIDRFAPVYPTSEALLTGRVAGLAGALRGGRN